MKLGGKGWKRGNGVKLSPRILIVDDHPAARITIRELQDWHSFQVCGDAQNGKEVIEKVIETKPDIVLLDINMPVMNGMQAAIEIRRIAPSTKVVFLTVHDGPGFRPRCSARMTHLCSLKMTHIENTI